MYVSRALNTDENIRNANLTWYLSTSFSLFKWFEKNMKDFWLHFLILDNLNCLNLGNDMFKLVVKNTIRLPEQCLHCLSFH